MFGVLVIVLGRYTITRLEFCLGQGYVPIIISSRVVRTLWLWPQRIRWSLLRAANKWSLLMPIHVCLPAMLHGSLLDNGPRSSIHEAERGSLGHPRLTRVHVCTTGGITTSGKPLCDVRSW